MDQKRRPNTQRLKGFDYSAVSAYFVTVCTKNRENILGRVDNSQIVLSLSGKILRECWSELPEHYPKIALDEFVIMPNHFHGIIVIIDQTCAAVGAGQRPARIVPQLVKHGLSEMVRNLKSFSARRINTLRLTKGIPVWHRGFYDRIIRNEKELYAFRKYIRENPRNWHKDLDFRS